LEIGVAADPFLLAVLLAMSMNQKKLPKQLAIPVAVAAVLL